MPRGVLGPKSPRGTFQQNILNKVLNGASQLSASDWANARGAQSLSPSVINLFDDNGQQYIICGNTQVGDLHVAR